MRLSTRLVPVPRLAPILVIVVLLVVAVAAVIWIGSRPRVPLPFGPARPGVLAYESATHMITVSNVDGSGPKQLSTDGSMNSNPTWSRDGTRIAFFSVPNGGTSAQLVVVTADGAIRRVLSSGLETTPEGLPLVGGPYWAPDGSAIAYLRIRDQTEEIDVVSLDGSAPRVLVTGAPLGANPAWKPDGSALAYCGSPDGVRRAVYLVAVPGNSTPQQLSQALSGDLVCPDVAWSPDGRTLAYRRGTDDGPTGGIRVWLLDANGRNERRLTDSNAVEMNPLWSPNGDRIAFGRRVGQDRSNGAPTFQLVIVDPDGRNEVAINGIAALWYGSWAWSPDGHQLLVQTQDNDNYLVDAAGVKAPISVPSWGDWQRLAE